MSRHILISFGVLFVVVSAYEIGLLTLIIRDRLLNRNKRLEKSFEEAKKKALF